MTTVAERIKHAKAVGYQVLDDFAMSDAGWLAYYQPLQKQVDVFESNHAQFKSARRLRQ